MKPILFNTEMVRAILDGCKSMTRRVAFEKDNLREFRLREYPEGWWFRGRAYKTWDRAMKDPQGVMSLCKFHEGDILYVRETWALVSEWTDVDPELREPDGYIYRADWKDGVEHPRWRPSIHMPKEAARLFLRVTNVRVEKLQEITMTEMKAEGVVPANVTGGQWQQWQREYMWPVWDSTIKKADLPRYGWTANPWVWVIEFERISKMYAYPDLRGGAI